LVGLRTLSLIASGLPLLQLLMGFESLWILLDLSANGVICLRHLTVLHPHCRKDLSHFSERVDLANIVASAIKELTSDLVNADLLLLAVVAVGDAATIGQGVVHGKLLLQLFDFVFISANQQVGV
jgi:hypothetical protein